MKTFNIVETVKSVVAKDLLNVYGTFYVRDLNMSYSISTCSFKLVDLSNAGKRGKTCKEWVMWSHVEFNIYDLVSKFENLEDFIMKLMVNGNMFNNVDFEIREYKKGVTVFNPMDLSVYKRLTETPKKWSIAHVVRAIVNGQYDELKCTGVYTDDYSYDAAVDYKRGNLDPIIFAERLVTGNDGWKAWESDDYVSINCYHFDNNKMKFNLDAGK